MMGKGLFLLACLLLAESQAFMVGPLATSTATRVFSQVADTVVDEIDYEAPEDAVVQIKPAAMKRLRELKEKDKMDLMVLKMGVRNGGCSGLSYVMDFSTEDAIQEDDSVDEVGYSQ
jgi:hypothetical protein